MKKMVKSAEYNSFRSSVPQRKIVVDDDGERAWTIYDAGPRSIRCPLMFLPPASGKADVFYKQILALSSIGYRCIAVEYPVYWHLRHWCEGFRKLLDHLNLDKVHIFGASLGGFLGQKFCEYTYQSCRVHSMILCNSFIDTNIFQRNTSANFFWTMPALALRKMVMGNFDKGLVDKDIAESIDFMVESLDNMGQKELASRLQLNCKKSYIEPQKLNSVEILIMDVNDLSALSHAVKEEMYKSYPNARRAHLKDGGNFPYLSRSAEVNVYIQVHMRQYADTKYAACESSKPPMDQPPINPPADNNNLEEQATGS